MQNSNLLNILISSRERALIEILSLVPKKMSFEHAALLFQVKSTLRPKLLQELLESSTSQQTGRLFIATKNAELQRKTKLLSFARRWIDNIPGIYSMCR